MTLEKPRKLSPYEHYLLREVFARLGIPFDERGEWTSLTEEELLQWVHESSEERKEC